MIGSKKYIIHFDMENEYFFIPVKLSRQKFSFYKYYALIIMEKQIDEILEVIQVILETAQTEFSEAATKLVDEQNQLRVSKALATLSQRWSGLDPESRTRVISKSQSESVKLEGIFRKLSDSLNEMPYVRENLRGLDEQIVMRKAEIKKLELV